MTIQPRKQTASLYLTLKVVQAINQLRRHVKPSVPGLTIRESTLLGPSQCLVVEKDALRGIEKCLSRVSPQSRKLLHQSPNRVCKKRKNGSASARSSTKLQQSERDDPVDSNGASEKMQHVLKPLDGQISAALTTDTCSDDKLFLKQNEVSFDGCTLHETIQFLILVYNAIGVLREVRSAYDDELLIAKGLEFGLNIDEKFIANYSHILLSLQAKLLETLARKVVETLIENDIDKRQRRLLNWLLSSAEHPLDSHLLSTTWPWSLKPSLAVLWGVCWMFYYGSNGEQRSRKGPNNERVRQERFLGELQWDAPAPNECRSSVAPAPTSATGAARFTGAAACANSGIETDLAFGLDMLGGTQAQQQQPQQQQQRQHQPLLRQSEAAFSEAAAGVDFPLDDAALSEMLGGGPGSLGVDLLNGTDGLGGEHTRSTSTYPPNSLASNSLQATENLLGPVNPANATHFQNIIAFPHQNTHQHTHQHQHSQQSPFPVDDDFPQPWHTALTQRPSPLSHSHNTHLAGSVSVPDLRVNDQGLAAPHNFAAYHSNTIGVYTHQPQAQSPLNLNTNLSNFPQSPYDMGHHERNDSVNSTSNMPTPISLGPRSPGMLSPVDVVLPPRRPSTASSHGHTVMRQTPEHAPSSEDGDNDGQDSPRMRNNNSYKRAEEPPKNAEGKMVCKHPECLSLIFDRKCEWSKHMDKHDRPYKCNVKGCEKLQGFTYSGGLLRHEREVHKMHGGTKKSLYCPFADCKRSTGAGFTRKENLAEHVRRVHRRTSMSSDLGHLIINRSDTMRDDASDSRLSPEMSYPRSLDGSEDGRYGLKRKRMSEAGISEVGGDEDLRAEVKRLRGDLIDRDAQIHKLGQAVTAKDERLRDLEKAVMSLQQQIRR